MNVLRNFSFLVYTIYKKFSILKQKFIDGMYILDKMNDVDKNVIRDNVIKYLILATMYFKEISIFINRYPELANYGIESFFMGPEDLNHFLKLINRNEVVQEMVGGKQIDLVQVPNVNSLNVGGRRK